MATRTGYKYIDEMGSIRDFPCAYKSFENHVATDPPVWPEMEEHSFEIRMGVRFRSTPQTYRDQLNRAEQDLMHILFSDILNKLHCIRTTVGNGDKALATEQLSKLIKEYSEVDADGR